MNRPRKGERSASTDPARDAALGLGQHGFELPLERVDIGDEATLPFLPMGWDRLVRLHVESA